MVWVIELNGPKFGAKSRSPTPGGPGKCRGVEQGGVLLWDSCMIETQLSTIFGFLPLGHKGMALDKHVVCIFIFTLLKTIECIIKLKLYLFHPLLNCGLFT